MGSTVERVVTEARRMAEEVARPLGLEVVEVVYRPQGKHTLLRIDVDRPGAAGASLADCERVSRDLEPRLDEADLVRGAYDLQVSSPGVERPLRSDDDFRRNAGRRVVVETTEPVAGRSRFRGVLAWRGDGAVRVVEEDGEEIAIPRERVSRAKQDAEADLRVSRRGPAGPERGAGMV